jgi:hypothetical protein
MQINHWSQVIEAVHILGSIGKLYDKDGIELRCASENTTFKEKEATKLKLLVQDRGRQDEGYVAPRYTNVANVLASIFNKYIEKLAQTGSRTWGLRKQEPPKKLLVLVLTDGLWQPETDARGSIRNLITKLKKNDYEGNQVGV